MRVLLVEDNRKISKLLCDGLAEAGFNAEPALTADEALAALSTATFSLVVLDLGLPDQDGIEVLNTLRNQKNSVPVLILTARDTLDQKLKGLNSGADDYMTKPFETAEVVARVRALLRRPSQAHNPVLELENIVFDTQARQAQIDDKVIRLSKRETSLLEIMLRSTGKTVPKENLEAQLYGFGEEGSANSIEVLVHRLRKKLIAEQARIEIHTLRGIGYMMTGAPDAKPG